MSQWDYFTDDIDDIENDNNIQLPVPESTQDYLVDDFSQFSYQDSFFQNSNLILIIMLLRHLTTGTLDTTKIMVQSTV